MKINKLFILSLLIIFSCQPEETTYMVQVNSSANGSVNNNMQEVAEGSTVTLTATPNQGYEFVEWSSSDGQRYTQNPLTIAVNNNLFLSPVFRAIKYELTVNKIGSGSIAQELVLGELQGLNTYTAGSQVDLIASPNSNYAFYNWNSVVTDTASVKRVTMDQSKEVTAYFDYEVAKQLVGTWEFLVEEPSTGKNDNTKKSFYRIRLTIDYGFNCLFSSFRGGIRRSYRTRIRPLSRTSCSIGGFGLLSGISFGSSSSLSCSLSTPSSPVDEITSSTEMEKSVEISANKTEDESLDKDENGLISESQSEIELIENQEEALEVINEAVEDVQETADSGAGAGGGDTGTTSGTISDLLGDTEPPILELQGDAQINLTVGDTFTDPGAIAVDTVDGSLTDQIQVTGTVDTSSTGSYTLVYSVSDLSSNVASATRLVVVSENSNLDTTSPTISLTGSDTIQLSVGDTFTDPGATATDNVDGNLTDSITVSGTVDTSATGTYTLEYSVSDAEGNSTSITRTVVVSDSSVCTQNCTSGYSLDFNSCDLTGLTNEGGGTVAVNSTAGKDGCGLYINHTSGPGPKISINQTFDYGTFSFDGKGVGGIADINVAISNDDGTLLYLKFNPDSTDTPGLYVYKTYKGESGVKEVNSIGVSSGNWFTGSIVVTCESVKILVNGSEIHSFDHDGELDMTDAKFSFHAAAQVHFDNFRYSCDTSGIIDLQAPTISLTGSATIELSVGDTFTDPGATATDDVDGNLTDSITVSGTVDTSATGTYTLEYSVSDAAGNSSSTIRTVVVSESSKTIIADYRFEANALDSSGNENHGTNTGGVYTTDRFGNENKAIYFSGASCGTRMDSDIDMSSVTDEFSISFWINRTGDGCILPRVFDFNDRGSGTNRYGTAWANGDGGYQGLSEAASNNTWYHIVHNFKGDGELTIFIDGEEVQQVANSGKTLPFTGDFALGRMNQPAYDAFNGKIDDVKMYNYILSQSEIDDLFGDYVNLSTTTSCTISGSLTSVNGSDSQTVSMTTAITDIEYTLTTTCSDTLSAAIAWTPSTPNGVSMSFSNNVATISGTPTGTATGTYNYTLTASNTAGTASATFSGSLTVESSTASSSTASGTTVTDLKTGSDVSSQNLIAFDGSTLKCESAAVGDYATINGKTYVVVDNQGLSDLNSDEDYTCLCTSKVTDMSGKINDNLFKSTTFNQDISSWDTSNVTAMEQMFRDASSFNQDISGWDVSNVTSFYRMFAYTSAFNQPIGSWDISSATTISGMFRGGNEQTRTVFDQDISSWDTSNVIDMSEVFAYADFNQDIGNWDVSSVRLLTAMFTYNPNFNQDIGGWDLSSMTDANNLINGQNYGDARNRMRGPFRNATSFNQDLTGWCVTDVTTEPDFFSDNSALTDANKPAWGTCPSDDTTPPVISITGSQTVNLTVGDSYTDAGATATDDTDGDITSSISTSGSVDTSSAGTSSITYTVSDAAGNSATATRTVIVSLGIACTPTTIYTDSSQSNFLNMYKTSSGNYIIRTLSGVYSSTSMSGPYEDLGFNYPTTNRAHSLLGENSQGDIFAASPDNGIFKYSNGTWASVGLSGFGTGGGNFLKLSNGRLILSKKGSLRKMYYSDDDGSTWTAASGDIAEDWHHIVNLNSNLFISSAGTQNKGGVITSSDNGSSWTKLRDQKTYMIKKYNDELYIISEEGSRGSGIYKLFKSSDNGQNWTLLSDLPNNNGIGIFIIHNDTIIFRSNSDGDYYCKNINNLDSSWNLFGTNEDLGTSSFDMNIIDDTPLIYTSTQIITF